MVCRKDESTWYKCQLSHDGFSPCCLSCVRLTRQFNSPNFSSIKVLTYLSFALNQGWNKDGHLVSVWQWKTPNSSVTHIEARRCPSYIKSHSRGKHLPLGISDTVMCCSSSVHCLVCCPCTVQTQTNWFSCQTALIKTSHLSSFLLPNTFFFKFH